MHRRAHGFRLRSLGWLGCAGAAMLMVTPAGGTTLRVGGGAALTLPSDAAAVAQPGDRVVITAGVYRDCAVWRVPGLRIEGEGVVTITGPVCDSKALFVIAAPDILIEGIVFLGAVAPDGNGAGIRAEGGNLTIRHSRFEGNQSGILTRWDVSATLLVEDSSFFENGHWSGQCAHALYAGRLAQVTIRRSRFEATRSCHHVKSRAARTQVTDSVIIDGPTGTASYLIDVPEGGDLVLRNSVLGKGALAENPVAAVVIGAEGIRQATRVIDIFDNSFTRDGDRGTVFVLNHSRTAARLRGNRSHGPVVMLAGPGSTR